MSEREERLRAAYLACDDGLRQVREELRSDGWVPEDIMQTIETALQRGHDFAGWGHEQEKLPALEIDDRGSRWQR